MTTEIEKTKRALYGCLDRIRRAGKHRVLTAEFEERLEEHLEVLRQHENNLSRNCLAHLENAGQMRQERDQIQQRLHAIDHAYLGSQTALGVAGDCIRDTQAVNREYQRLIKERDDQIVALKESLEANRDRVESLLNQNKASGEELIRVQGIARQYLDDCRSAEKHSDEFSEKLRDAQAVIGHQEQLIVGQRLAIADLYLAGRRVNSAVATLQRLGYTDCGGQLWKPPLGKKPDFGQVGSPSGSGDTCWRCGTPQ
jgi:chromosome segregation ATPase